MKKSKVGLRVGTLVCVALLGVTACGATRNEPEGSAVRSTQAVVRDFGVQDFRMNAQLPAKVPGEIGGYNQPANAFPYNTVTLTFDDGPDEYTLLIGRYLRDQGIRATFFVRTCRLLGQPLPSTADPGDPGQPPICLRQCRAGESPPCGQFPVSWLQQLKDMGHRIANHTKNHYHLDSASAGAIVDEVGGAQQVLDAYVTDGIYAFRAPYHAYNAFVANTIRTAFIGGTITESPLRKLTGPVGDDIDADDWGQPAADVKCAKDTTPGSAQRCAEAYLSEWNSRPNKNGIIQLHDGNEFAPGLGYPLKLTEALVTLLQSHGAHFVPLDAVPGITGLKTFDVGSYRTSDFSDAATWGTNSSYYASIHLADVGGDEHDDVCGRSPAGIVCGIANANGFAPATLWRGPEFSDADGWLPDQYGGTIVFGDIDNDILHKADVCGRGASGLFCAPSNITSGFSARTLWTTSFSDADGWDTNPSYYKSIRLADVDNDGAADACGRAWGGIYCAISHEDGFFPGSVLTGNFRDNEGWASEEYGSTIQFADLNGDKRMDVCGRGALGMFCALGVPNSVPPAFGPATLWSQWGAFSDADGWNLFPSYYRSIQLGDVDGDGMADVCGRAATGIVCAFSDGYGFKNYVHVRNDFFTDSLGWAAPQYGSTLQLAGHKWGERDAWGNRPIIQKAAICGRGFNGIFCATAR